MLALKALIGRPPVGTCTAMMLAALVTATSSASASSSWQLVDEYTSHPVCYTLSGGKAT